MIVNDIHTSYFWRNDFYIKRELEVTTFDNGQRVESVVEYPLYNKNGKEVKEFDPIKTIDKLI